MKMTANTRICNDRYFLRTVEMDDAESLRIWKNEHKEFFFQKKEITPDEQAKWISSLNDREHDHMFVVMDNDKRIGCIGARLYNNAVDIYNVILGDKQYKGQHVMKNALWAMSSLCSLIYPGKQQIVRVLLNNPAIMWYQKIGFKTVETIEDHVIMQFDPLIISEKYDFSINISLPNNLNNIQ